MSPQAVARLFVRDDICPECREVCDLFHLTVLVRDRCGEERHQTWEGCLTCIKREHPELSEKLRIKDVIDVPSKAAKQSQNKKARRREERAGEDIGGRRVPGSGSQEAKGDARNEHWMVEDKHTSGKTFTLSKAVLSKAASQARKTGRNAVIKVGLADGTELAVCHWSDFTEVISE